MKFYFKLMGMLTFVAFIQACQSSPGQNDGLVLNYVKDAINIWIAATPDLNFYNNQPHAVVLTFYELSQPNIFNQMLESREGMAQLVTGGEFDKTVLSHRSVVIQPGEFRQLLMDRVDGARYLAVVAGYYDSKLRSNSETYPIQLYKSITFFWRNMDKNPKMLVNIRLGRSGIVKLRNIRQ